MSKKLKVDELLELKHGGNKIHFIFNVNMYSRSSDLKASFDPDEPNKRDATNVNNNMYLSSLVDI